LRRTSGEFVPYTPADNDDERGEALQTALFDAKPGDTVEVGPGNFKTVNVTRDQVYLYLLPGARIYHTATNLGAIVQVAAGSHHISGYGVLEHLGTPSPSRSARAIAVTGGSLRCEASEIISTAPDNSAVFVQGSATTNLRLNARSVVARVYDGLEIHDCTCLIEVDSVISEGDADGNAIEVTSGTSVSNRVIHVGSARSANGPTVLALAIGRMYIRCESIENLNGIAVHCASALGVLSAGVIRNQGTLPGVRLSSGICSAVAISHSGSSYAVELQTNSRLAAELVEIPDISTAGGIKIASSFEGFEPILDVGSIRAGNSVYSVFTDPPAPPPPYRGVFVVRDFRSNRPIDPNVTVLSPNH
jgi:hypothetical protein